MFAAELLGDVGELNARARVRATFDPPDRSSLVLKSARAADPKSPATPLGSLVGAAGFEPATFGSQNRNSKSKNLNEVENLQRFRRSSLVGRLAYLAQLAHMAGFLYPDLTPAPSGQSACERERSRKQDRAPGTRLRSHTASRTPAGITPASRQDLCPVATSEALR